jgi:hypothetical protein
VCGQQIILLDLARLPLAQKNQNAFIGDDVVSRPMYIHSITIYIYVYT